MTTVKVVSQLDNYAAALRIYLLVVANCGFSRSARRCLGQDLYNPTRLSTPLIAYTVSNQ